MSEKPKRDSIELSPLEQKYLASCYPLADRPFIEEANTWKEILREKSKEEYTVELPIAKIGRAFPHLGSLQRKGFFDDRSVKDYFEATDRDSHNMKMYLFAKKLSREHLPASIMDTIMDHVEACSVKVAQILNPGSGNGKRTPGKIWSYGETYNDMLDLDYLKTPIKTPYVFIHGRSENGPIVIRDAGPDFEPFKEWFEQRQKNGGKIFKKK